MSNGLRVLNRIRHGIATALVVCCTLLSTVTSFQHADCLLADLRVQAQVFSSSSPASNKNISHRLNVAERLPASDHHCLACEWQAASVSKAIPSPAFIYVPRSITLLIRALPRPPTATASARASSRAPPLA